MSADPYAGTPYAESPDGWWTKYGGAKDVVSGVVFIPRGADLHPCPHPCAYCRYKGLQPKTGEASGEASDQTAV